MDSQVGIEEFNDIAKGGEVENQELNLQGVVDTGVLRLVPQEAQVLTSYVANKALFWLFIDVLEVAGEVSFKWDPTSIALTQIKKKIDDLQSDMEKMLDKDYLTSYTWLRTALISRDAKKYELCVSELEKVLNHSIDAFSVVKSFKKKVDCKKMTIFSLCMIGCYDSDKQTFC